MHFKLIVALVEGASTEIDLEDIHAVHVTDEALASIEAELAERGHLDVWPDELSEILDLRVPWARSQYFQD